MSLTSSAKAVVIKTEGVAAVETLPIPKMRDDYILVKTKAVAINPTDWKHVSWWGKPGRRVGCDYVGHVVKVGSKVTKTFAPGDRIAGFVHGANSENDEDGAFGEYIIAKGDIQIKVPDNIPDEEAATWGVTITTVGQGLYQSLKLPLPSTPATTPSTVLIYGGSTATGIAGIQLAKLSGWNVVTTASPRNFDYLKSLGADAVFDYRSPSCVADIAKFADGRLTKVWDCISTEDSMKICVSAMNGNEPGQYQALAPVNEAVVKAINPNVSSGATFGYTAMGEEFTMWQTFAASKEDFNFAKMFWEQARELLAQGKLKLAKPILNRGGNGLDGVLIGMEDLKADKVSAGKLVYTL